MAREIASTRIQGSDSRTPSPESPVVNAAATTRVPWPLFLVPNRLVPHRLTPEERHHRICDLAYRRAEQRGFTAGGELEDWLEAEREVDAGRY